MSNRPRLETETFQEYRENLKKETAESKKHLAGVLKPNQFFTNIRGVTRTLPRTVNKVVKKQRIDKNKKGA